MFGDFCAALRRNGPAALCSIDESFAVFTINDLKCMPTLCDEPKLRPSAERLAEIITSLQRCLILKLSKELSRGNVSFPQYCLLGMLREEKQLTMSEIAQRMGHSTAAATGLIDRLENLGHVRRTHAKDDRRKVLVQITASGLALVAEVRDDMVSNVLKIMTLLDTHEQKTWLQIYEKIFSYCQPQ